MATRAEKKRRRLATGSPAEQTTVAKRRTASLGRKTTGAVGASSAPSILPDDAGKGEVQKDAALLTRSIRERWPTTHEKRTALRRRLQSHAMKTKDDAILAKLVTVDVRMEQQNLQVQRLQLEAAGLIGSGRDPFTEQPTAPAVQIGQVNFYLPDNQRGPNSLMIDNASTTRRTVRR